MWIARRDAVRTWIFDLCPFSSEAISSFISENAPLLLQTISDLDTETSAAVFNHVKVLEENLLAIHLRRDMPPNESEIATMNFATEQQGELK